MPTNKHSGFRETFFQELGPKPSCPRRKCTGTMTIVYVRYEDKGYVYEEQECTTCGKVIKHPLFKEHIAKRKHNQKQERQNAHEYRRRSSKKHNCATK